MRYFEKFHNAVAQLHYNYGKGDIVEIRRFADGKLEIEAKRTRCHNHIARGMVETLPSGAQKVCMYRHQITFRIA